MDACNTCSVSIDRAAIKFASLTRRLRGSSFCASQMDEACALSCEPNWLSSRKVAPNEGQNNAGSNRQLCNVSGVPKQETRTTWVTQVDFICLTSGLIFSTCRSASRRGDTSCRGGDPVGARLASGVMSLALMARRQAWPR